MDMAAKYKVLSQKQDTVINPSGTNFDDIWEVHYQVTDGPAKGTNGVVKVSESDHNAKAVDQAISDKIASLSDVANLGG